MNKAEFIDELSNKTKLSKSDSKKVLEAVLETITEQLAKGESVSFIGFATFSTTPRAAKTCRVPGTDRTVEVEATNAVKFKVGKALKDSVHGGK